MTIRRISGNETMEILRIEAGDSFQPRVTHNSLQTADDRAKWAMSIIQAWGMGATFADVMGCLDKDHPVKPVPPNELVMRVCEVVDAAWSEMRHRGWIISSESIED